MNPEDSVITMPLIEEIHRGCRLNWNGIHGIAHWARVREFGLLLADKSGADKTIVELFSILHDSKRKHDGKDNKHGLRSAEFAKTLNERFFNLTAEQMELLFTAIAHHTSTRHHHHVSVQTCWDADRLDIGRIWFLKPNPKYLNTDYAKSPEMLDYAYAKRNYIPDIVKVWS